jgi:hypothetical protein
VGIRFFYSELKRLINASALPDARSRVKRERRRGVLRASGKAVWTWPSVVAVDAGPMQIQLWEGAALAVARLCCRA